VTATLPIAGRVGVGTANTVSVTFSLTMQASTLDAQPSDGACTGSVQLQVGPDFASCLGGTLATTDNRTFTFTPAAPLPADTALKLRVTSTATSVDGGALIPFVASFVTTHFPSDARVLYVITTNGNLGGAAGADAKCTGALGRPAGVTAAKAVLADSTRIACSVPNCGSGNVQTQWAMAPNTNYVRADGAFVWTTDANGIFTAWPMAQSLGSEINFWDGLNADWTSLTPNCSDWSDGSASASGTVGWDPSTASDWLVGGQLTCDFNGEIVCAEQ
jgi:hypothetical protein